MSPTFNLDRSWIYKVTVLADRVARLTSAVAATQGLNLSQWRVLAALGEREGLTASQVVAMTPMDKGIVSRAVKTLGERGLLRREASQADARQSHLRLTGEGRETFEAIVAELDRVGAHGVPELEGKALDAFLVQLDALIAGYPGPETR